MDRLYKAKFKGETSIKKKFTERLRKSKEGKTGTEKQSVFYIYIYIWRAVHKFYSYFHVEFLSQEPERLNMTINMYIYLLVKYPRND